MNDYQVLQRLKADRVRCDIPVITVSARAGGTHLVGCRKIGAADYLPKPCNPVRWRGRASASREKKRWRAQEVAYMHNMARVTNAGAALESGQFEDLTQSW